MLEVLGQVVLLEELNLTNESREVCAYCGFVWEHRGSTNENSADEVPTIRGEQ